MRIKGLIRIFNQVRSQLQTGLRPEDVEQFRQRVKRVVRDVEDICRHHGTTPESLPAPSRMAYIFLKELDLDNLPLNQTGENTGTTAVLKVKNVVKNGDYFAERLWQNLNLLLSSPGHRDQTKREMGEHASSIERICQIHGVTPSALEIPSRQIYCWLKFLSSEDNLELHLEALQRAKSIIKEQHARHPLPVYLHLTVMNALWRKRQYPNASLIKVNEGFLYADRDVWRAIIHNALSDCHPDHDLRIREYAMTDDFDELLIEIESAASPPALPPRGRVHNLDESFDRVNSTYFGGLMERPKIVWNRAPTMHKFGHYQTGRDTIMISVSLDDPGIPNYVIDFVMYHELLHKKHGSAPVNGRRQVHSPSFRADERRFAQYSEAKHTINNLARKQRGLNQDM
jgi:hypothetical protein